MPRFEVHATQVITQKVVFEIEAEDQAAAIEGVESMNVKDLVDSEDEQYHANIVTLVVELKVDEE